MHSYLVTFFGVCFSVSRLFRLNFKCHFPNLKSIHLNNIVKYNIKLEHRNWKNKYPQQTTLLSLSVIKIFTFINLKDMIKAQNFDDIKREIMSEVQLKIQRSMAEIRLELLTNNKKLCDRQLNIQIEMNKLAANQQQVQSMRKMIKNIRSQLQSLQSPYKQLKDLRNQNRLIIKSIKQLEAKIEDYLPKNQMREPKFVKKEFEAFSRSLQQIQPVKRKATKNANKKVDSLTFGQVDPKSADLDHFKINEKIIKKIDKGWHYLYGNVPIQNKKTNIFTIQQQSDKKLEIGLVNHGSYKRNNKKKGKQSICYLGEGGICQNEKIKKQRLPTIKKGSVVKMTVEDQKVIWNIDGQIIQQSSTLVNQKWIPYIMIYDAEQIITWQ